MVPRLLALARAMRSRTCADVIQPCPRPHVIGFNADLFFPLLRADLFFSGFAVKLAGYVWTVAVSGEKNLRIRKYPDMDRALIPNSHFTLVQ